jgi:hypothetical protein
MKCTKSVEWNEKGNRGRREALVRIRCFTSERLFSKKSNCCSPGMEQMVPSSPPSLQLNKKKANPFFNPSFIRMLLPFSSQTDRVPIASIFVEGTGPECIRNMHIVQIGHGGNPE